MGTDGFAIKVEAEGLAGAFPRTYACSISGREEGRATGIVAALVAERLYASSCRPGVYHIEQLFDPLAVSGTVSAHGFEVELGGWSAKDKPHSPDRA